MAERYKECDASMMVAVVLLGGSRTAVNVGRRGRNLGEDSSKREREVGIWGREDAPFLWGRRIGV